MDPYKDNGLICLPETVPSMWNINLSASVFKEIGLQAIYKVFFFFEDENKNKFSNKLLKMKKLVKTKG